MTSDAVILAAGLGRRLGPLTADRPKATVEVLGRTLLERAITTIESVGIERVTIITGYRAASVEDLLRERSFRAQVATSHNPQFATTNNIVSFLHAAPLLRDGALLLNSDVIFHPAIIDAIESMPDGSWLVVDDTQPLDAEDMKVAADERGVIRQISKGLNPGTAVGEYIGVARLDQAGAGASLDAATELVRAGGDQLYYEDAIDRAASSAVFRVCSTGGAAWTEVDDLDDYQRAVRIAKDLDARLGSR
jgi:choline kinase